MLTLYSLLLTSLRSPAGELNPLGNPIRKPMKLFSGKKPKDKADVKLVNLCNVYISRECKKAIVASTDFVWGIYSEKDDGATLLDFNDPSELGPLIESKFFDCEYIEKDDYPAEKENRKESDWPAYKSSKAKSMKQFKKDYVRYTLSGANYANIIIIAESQTLPNDIKLTTSITGTNYSTIAGQKVYELHLFFLKVESLFGL
jgi:hypothetical protein